MFKFFIRFRLQVSIVVVLIGLFLLMFQTNSNKGHSHLQSAIQTFTYPIQASVHSLASSLRGFWYSYISLVDVKEENKRLRKKILDMEESINQHIENSVQFLRLRDQLLFASKKTKDKIFAEIIGESLDNTHNIRLINRGSNQLVLRNYVVL